MTEHESDRENEPSAVESRLKHVKAQLDFLEARLPEDSPFVDMWKNELDSTLDTSVKRAVDEGRLNATIVSYADAGITYEPDRKAAEGLLAAFGTGYFKNGEYTPVGLDDLGALQDLLPRASSDEIDQSADGSYIEVDEAGETQAVVLQTSIDGSPVDGIRIRLDGKAVTHPGAVAPQLRPCLIVRTG